MKKLTVILLLGLLLVVSNTTVNARTINEANTELCETLKYALIGSLRELVNEAIVEIYKDDLNAPEGLTWELGYSCTQKALQKQCNYNDILTFI